MFDGNHVPYTWFAEIFIAHYTNLRLHSISDAVFRMKEGCWSKRVDVQRAAAKSSELNIHLISQEYGITTLDIIIHNKQDQVKIFIDQAFEKLTTWSGEGGGCCLSVWFITELEICFLFSPTYNFGILKKMLHDFLMMFRETSKRLYFSFSVGLDVSKVFSPHYTGVEPYIIVSSTTDILYLRYYNLSTNGFG